MKKNLYLAGLFISLIFLTYLYFSKDSVEEFNQATKTTWTEKKVISKNSPKNNKKSSIKILPVGAKRIFPKRKIPNHIITNLIEIEDTNDLKRLANRIKLWSEADSSDFSFKKTIQWDISQMPTNNTEYHLFLSEVSSFVLNELSQAIIDGDLKKVKIRSAQQFALRIYSLFDFTNQKDADGKHILLLSGLDEYIAKKNKERRDRLPAASKANVYNILSTADEIHPDLLSRLKNEQTDYFAELPGDTERQRNFIEGDPLNNTYLIIDLIEFIMGKLNENDVNFSSANRFHKKNMELIQNIVNDARANPEKYGKKNITDMTDLDFEIFLKEISRDTAKFWALIGSAFSVAFGEFLTTFFTSVRLSFTLNAFAYVGFEIICTATGLYQGIKQMYIMHRFNSYIRGVKFGATKSNRTFNYHRVNQKFAPELIKHGHSFRKLVRDSWLTGVAIGVGIKTFASRELLDTGILKIIEKTMASSSTLFRKMGNRTLNLYAAKSIEELIVHLFPRITKILASSKITTFILKSVSTFLGPILKGISYPILTAVDMGVVYFVTSFGINIRLQPAINILTKTYASPGTNIQIALANLENAPKSFKQATQNIFYPLCAYLATFEKYDVPEAGYAKRQEGCTYIIKELESFNSNEELQASFPEVYKTLTLSQDQVTRDLRIKEEQIFNKILNDSYYYPPTFKTFWLTGLMSILPRDLITNLYWDIKSAMIYGTNKVSSLSRFTTNVFSPDIISPSILMNIERLDYATNLLSTYIYEKENNEEETPSNNRSYKGFITYTKFHQRIISDIMINYNHALAKGDIKSQIDINNEKGSTLFEQFGQYISKTKGKLKDITHDAKEYIKEGIKSSAPYDSENSASKRSEKEVQQMIDSGILLY